MFFKRTEITNHIRLELFDRTRMINESNSLVFTLVDRFKVLLGDFQLNKEGRNAPLYLKTIIGSNSLI